MDAELLTMAQAAALVHRSYRHLRALVLDGEGPPAYRYGRQFVLKRSEVLAWFEQQLIPVVGPVR